jgi:hypothetical protein
MNGCPPSNGGAINMTALTAHPEVVLHERVSGPSAALAEYLAGVEQFLRRYVAFPSEHEPVAITLWIGHAHLVERFESSPILAVTSAEVRSGKTRVLDCLELLVPEPFRVVTPSEAVVYTVLAQRPRRTMLLDEADAIFGPRTADRYEGLRAILNAGNRQGTPVLRVKLEGRRRAVDAFDVFGPKAIAGIGNLPSTVADRAIPIRMKRRMPGEPIAKFRHRIAAAEAALIGCDWASVTLGTDVTVPDELNDRAADSWESLLAIADAAGGSWPTRARLAAVALSGEEEATISIGMRLLADIKDVFGDEDHLTTAELLRRLHNLEDAPWSDWYGAPLSGRGLAKLLAPYRIAPMKRRVRGEQSRGYFRSDFEDAFRRYVPESVPSVPSVPLSTSTSPGGTDTGRMFEHDGALGTLGTLSRTQDDEPEWAIPRLAATIACADYDAHQSWHRRTPAGWICDACSAGGNVDPDELSSSAADARTDEDSSPPPVENGYPRAGEDETAEQMTWID